MIEKEISKEYEKLIDKNLDNIKKILINSYSDGEIKELTIHNIQSFQDGNFTYLKKKNKLKLTISLNHKQFTQGGCLLPTKPNHWRIQPLMVCVWKESPTDDEKR